jgi:prophage maintenance system killer protein
MEPVRNDTTTDRRTAVELAKRLLVDSIWRTAKIEVDGVTFPDTQEIFDGRAPEGMSVDDIVTVNNIKRAWRFLLENIDYPVDWQYIREYNRIIGEGLVRDAGRLREYGVRIGGTGWVPEIPAVESPQERVRGILEESEGEDTAMLLFGAVTRGQWFSDGNKRTALMVANHQLIHDGIGVFSIPPEDKAQFVSMLLRYYETGDYSRLSDWLSQNAVGHVPIVGFREENGFTFDDVKPIAHGNVGSILLPASQVPDKYVLSDKLWTYLQNYKKKHEAAGNGFGYGMVDAATDHTRTLSARYGKDGSEILVSRGEGKNPRRLTPRECARLMGYPDSFSIPVSDTQAYRQFGNSVAVPVIRAIGEAMKPYLSD